jgi:DNA (cytosine-5)-methyltransferase 1
VLAQKKMRSTDCQSFTTYDFRKYKGGQPLNKIARNLVDYEAGKVILDVVMGIVKKKDERQIELF